MQFERVTDNRRFAKAASIGFPWTPGVDGMIRPLLTGLPGGVMGWQGS